MLNKDGGLMEVHIMIKLLVLHLKKYGWDNFEHEIVYNNLTKEEACIYEQELIEKYNTMSKDFGYNRSKGGDSGSFGAYDTQLNRMVHVFQYDIEGNFIKEHISISSAVRELMSGYTGHNSYNISTCCKGKRLTALGYRWFYEYQGEKIEPIKTAQERTIDGRSRRVYQYSLEGYFIREYKSVSQAIEVTNILGIQHCASGCGESAGGYRWFYEYQGEKIEPYKKHIAWNAKTVYVYDLKGTYYGEYMSAQELSNISEDKFGVKFRSPNISQVCNHKRNSYKGYIFSYEPLDEENLSQYMATKTA